MSPNFWARAFLWRCLRGRPSRFAEEGALSIISNSGVRVDDPDNERPLVALVREHVAGQDVAWIVSTHAEREKRR